MCKSCTWLREINWQLSKKIYAKQILGKVLRKCSRFVLYIKVGALTLNRSQPKTKMKSFSSLSLLILIGIVLLGNCKKNKKHKQLEYLPRTAYISLVCSAIRFTENFQSFSIYFRQENNALFWNNCKSIGEQCIIPEICCTLKCIKGIHKCFF